MATNGESARQWLKENHGKISSERIQLIRASINQKIDRLEPSNEEYEGFVEALDVIDHYLSELSRENDKSTKTDKDLDFSPLIPETSGHSCLSEEEKTRRFRELLKTSAI